MFSSFVNKLPAVAAAVAANAVQPPAHAIVPRSSVKKKHDFIKPVLEDDWLVADCDEQKTYVVFKPYKIDEVEEVVNVVKNLHRPRLEHLDGEVDKGILSCEGLGDEGHVNSVIEGTDVSSYKREAAGFEAICDVAKGLMQSPSLQAEIVRVLCQNRSLREQFMQNESLRRELPLMTRGLGPESMAVSLTVGVTLIEEAAAAPASGSSDSYTETGSHLSFAGPPSGLVDSLPSEGSAVTPAAGEGDGFLDRLVSFLGQCATKVRDAAVNWSQLAADAIQEYLHLLQDAGLNHGEEKTEADDAKKPQDKARGASGSHSSGLDLLVFVMVITMILLLAK